MKIFLLPKLFTVVVDGSMLVSFVIRPSKKQSRLTGLLTAMTRLITFIIISGYLKDAV